MTIQTRRVRLVPAARRASTAGCTSRPRCSWGHPRKEKCNQDGQEHKRPKDAAFTVHNLVNKTHKCGKAFQQPGKCLIEPPQAEHLLNDLSKKFHRRKNGRLFAILDSGNLAPICDKGRCQEGLEPGWQGLPTRLPGSECPASGQPDDDDGLDNQNKTQRIGNAGVFFKAGNRAADFKSVRIKPSTRRACERSMTAPLSVNFSPSKPFQPLAASV